MRRRTARLCRDRKSDQIEKNKRLEKYFKFEKEWLKRVQNRRDEE